MTDGKPAGPLRYGWTTGACAAAAAKAAYAALLTGEFPDPVRITLPRGEMPAFALAAHELRPGEASAAIVKDAGDDPDVTHGALVRATVRPGAPGSGVTFRAGEGVGTVTKAGLPLPVGEPAINPGPRGMIAAALAEVAQATGAGGDVEVTVSIPNGEAIARKTLNGRLGIVGGLSILGTTGIVVPFSCSAWIHSIHRGIDVARAAGLDHIAGATGAASEAAVARLFGLEEAALIDMGDFVGGMLKYIRVHPVARVTVAGGFAKITKLAQGLLDLHSRAGAVDFRWLAERVHELGGDGGTVHAVSQANTAIEALEIAARAGLALPQLVARRAHDTAAAVLRDSGVALDIAVFDRDGRLLASAGGAPAAFSSQLPI
ncbi:cobalt-precorrin-5B (C(1))-methyltransferase [Labrys monachus]|uniref:Cobalt-precorrin-5B C(1)-methyltransferase n=1 Tax=Labrys monachus TaxID=217067 RepID=A0ABU0F8W5_9HYPH|nr:cobalt-precorrin-5B (C(1))-methyltransferase [Labrys monachus]MDQ0391042.1 cobalt-precorrin-5B (C1)-methyltransferase [Labrys monachus]